MILTSLIVFVFGTIWGSFLNVLLWRLPENQTIGGRSHCRSCHQTLAWYDLVPILSFVFLRGRCRYCQNKIHNRYPIIEADSGTALLLLYLFNMPSEPIAAIFSIYGVILMLSLFFFDLFYFILPDKLILPALVAFTAYDLVILKDPHYLISALLFAAFFAILYVASGGTWLGFGDVKLAALLGLMISFPMVFWVIVCGIWAGALWGISLMLMKRASSSTALPFGSFLTAAALVFLIFGNEIHFFEKFFR